ncbi:MAG: outer membrane beta-barrel family protein [Bacteroidales bacterium]
MKTIENAQIISGLENLNIDDLFQVKGGTKAIIICSVLLLFCNYLSAQHISSIYGIVKDKSGISIPFANVVVFTLPDSTLITGSTTDTTGFFSIKIRETKTEQLLLMVSCIGYTKTYRHVDKSNLGDIILKDDETLLHEIVIKGHKPTYKMEGGALISSIQNTALSTSGTANDVLKQLPLIIERNGKLNVLGKGEPVIYINNRLVRDKAELQRLSSKEIKSIKLITTPGASYDSNINAVIRITTIKSENEGWGGSVNMQYIQAEVPRAYMNGKIKYQIKKIEFFLGASMVPSKINNTRYYNTYITKNDDWTRTITDGDYKYDYLSYNINGGFNYDITPSQSIGIRYDLDKQPRSDFEYTNDLISESKRSEENYQSSVFSKQQASSGLHHINGYYDGSLSKNLNLVIDANYLHGSGKDSTITDERYSDIIKYVSSKSNNAYDLFATKMEFEWTIGKSVFSFGGEYNYTNHKYDYQPCFNDENIEIDSTNNKSTQNFLSPFIIFNTNFGKWALSAGLRYEFTSFNYYINSVREEEQSKKYNNVLPNLSISYNGSKIRASINYRSRVLRPSYSQLSSSLIYTSPSLYESGNPFLKPNIRHSVDVSLSWKDIQVMLSYQKDIRKVAIVSELYENKLIAVSKPINLPDYNQYQFVVSYAPTFGIWSPNVQLAFVKQSLKYGVPELSYNKPLMQISFNNQIQLPWNLSFFANFNYTSRGNSCVVYTESFSNLSVSLTKRFLSNRLMVSLSGNDLFNTDRSYWTNYTNGINMISHQNGSTRSMGISVNYSFNTPKNKHNNSAGNSEINRLK